MIVVIFRKNIARFLLFVAVIEGAPAHSASGQNFPFREYSVIDGLPQSQSTSVFQDTRGYIWITTKNGLSRFDGIEFVNFNRKDGLPTNDFTQVLEDSLGVIWAACKNYGLSKFDGQRFENFPLDSDLENLKSSTTHGGSERNVICYLTNRPDKFNLRIFRFSNGHYYDYSSRFKAIDTLSLSTVCRAPEHDAFIIRDKYQNVWTWKDNVLSPVSKIKFDYLINKNGTPIFQKGTDLFQYDDGILHTRSLENTSGEVRSVWDFIERKESVILFNGKAFSKINLSFVPTQVLTDREGVLWFASEKNVERLISTAFSSFSEPDIGLGNIWAINEDRNGHLWFGSLYGDLMEYDGSTFKKRNDYRNVLGKEVGFYKGSRRMSDGDLWLSTDNGVLIWNGKNFSRLASIPAHSEICYIYEDPDDKTVMVGAAEGLYIIKNHKVILKEELRDTQYGVVEGVTKDKQGRYWLSGHKGLTVLDGDSLIRVKEETFPHISSYTLVTDKSGGIWVTSEVGLYFKDPSSDKFRFAFPDSVNTPANSIILMDSMHVLAGRVSDIAIIDLGEYYKNHRKGLRFYDKSNGFEGGDCLDNGIIEDMNGIFWIATSNRIVKFEPSRLKINSFPPLLHITGLYFKNDSLEWVSASDNSFYYGIPQNLNLKWHDRTVRITFSGISTTNPEKVTYRYRLLGLGNKWSQPVKGRSVIYENLPHRKYKFELLASNADGIATPEPVTLEFRIMPAFWQSTMFIMSSVILLIGLTVIATKHRLRRIHKRLEDEQSLKSELAHLQLNSVLKQFDPHFTFNVISSVGSLIMKGEKDSAYEYITRLSALLRSILGNGSIIIRPLRDELEFVTSYCELQKLRFKNRLNYSITVESSVNKDRMIPKMTIQTFVENSIKHGIEHRKEGGKVDVEISKQISGTEIIIYDNGIGREGALKYQTTGTGQGLKTIADIFEMMNKFNREHAWFEITDLVTNGHPSGTRVRINIPDEFSYENMLNL